MYAAALHSAFETVLAKADIVPSDRKYWFIRTESGRYFETFHANSFVAIEDNLITFEETDRIRRKYEKFPESRKYIIDELKALCEKRYSKKIRTGLVASQIYRFLFEVKKGDIVIIPDQNSSAIVIGEICDTTVCPPTPEEIEKTQCDWLKRKRVNWRKFIPKQQIDPFLYRILSAHQAITNVTPYRNPIERSMQNFFLTEDTANLIIEVQSSRNINARNLFKLGLSILDYTQKYMDENGIGLDTNNVDVKIALNSPGKIQLTAQSKVILFLTAILIIGINGGGLKINVCDKFDLDLSTRGAIQNVIDYQNDFHDREMKNAILSAMDSLRVQTPDDVVKVFRQFSTNKPAE